MSEEFKTLNDFIDYSKSQTGNRVIEKLREEAIKWYKGRVIDWREFFGITDEDLK